MKKYGIQESRIQLFKISYKSLQMHKINDDFQFLCLYKNDDTVNLCKSLANQQWYIILEIK